MLNREHYPGLILLSGLILIAALISWLANGPLPKTKVAGADQTLIIGVSGQTARPGIYVLEPGQGPDDLARLAGFAPGLLPKDFGLQNGQRLVITGRSFSSQPLSEAHRRLAGLKININRASAEDLKLLPGIGPSRARAVIATRNRLGWFNNINDLDLVPGLGPKRISNLAGEIEF